MNEHRSRRFYYTGWKPTIGWACAAGVVYAFVGAPVLTGFVNLFWKPEFKMLSPDGHLWELVTAAFTLGALNTYDRMRGVDPAQATQQVPVAVDKA